jgi:hypothetical protein
LCVLTPHAQEALRASTTFWFHGTVPDTTFFLVENWIFTAVVDAGQQFRHAGLCFFLNDNTCAGLNNLTF